MEAICLTAFGDVKLVWRLYFQTIEKRRVT